MDDANATFTSADGVLFDKAQAIMIAFPGGRAGSYVVPIGVATIGEWAFSECAFLTNVLVSGNVTNIGYQGFSKCSKLESINLPNGIKRIGDWAFYLCSALTGIELPNSLTSIGADAFYLAGLTNIAIPDSVTEIGTAAFSDTPLGTVTVGDGVASIPSGTFQNCSSVTNVTLPPSLDYIGSYAFFNCKKLSSIAIPGSVTNIGMSAFQGCSALTGAYFNGNAPSSYSNVFANDTLAIVYYLPGTTGWTSTLGGAPTALWFLPNPVILSFEPSFGIRTNKFSFLISWATNSSVIVEASTNLGGGVWQPIQTNALVNGTNAFVDSTWTNYPQRFYRVHSQ